MDIENSHAAEFPLDDDWSLLRLEIREAGAEYRRHITALTEILRRDIQALTENVRLTNAKLDSLQR
jgi:hypothetical protein